MMTERLDELVAERSNELHQSLARANSDSCLLLIDRRLRPFEGEHPLQVYLPEAVALDPRSSRLDAGLTPALHRLDRTNSSGSFGIQESIRAALEELAPEQLAAGDGRRIAAWIVSDAEPKRTARHLAQHLIQLRRGRNGTSATPTLLHFYDPAVMWLLWPLLDVPQRAALFGPVRQWWLLDPLGCWQTLSIAQEDVTDATRSLELRPEQWRDILGIGALNAALREWLPRQTSLDSEGLARHCAATMGAMRRAHGYGWHMPQDLALFALHSLSIAENFDSHPTIRTLIAKREADDRYSAVVDALTDEDWARIASDCL